MNPNTPFTPSSAASDRAFAAFEAQVKRPVSASTPTDNVFAMDLAANPDQTVTGNTVPRDKPTSREAIQAYRTAMMKQVRRMRLAAKKGPAKIVTRYTRRGKPVY